MNYDDADYEALERAMLLRLAAELHIDSTCPKCIVHQMKAVAPELRPAEMYGYTDSRGGKHDWVKDKLDQVAQRCLVMQLPYKRALTMLEESDTEGDHIDHLPPEALEIPAIVVEINLGAGSVRNIFVDGNHRATWHARAERPVPIRWIRKNYERLARPDAGAFAQHARVAQRNGFMTWELPTTYAVSVDGHGRARFGRLVRVAKSPLAHFQEASNSSDLLEQAGDLVAGERRGMYMLPLDMRPRYDAISRRACFGTALVFKQRDVEALPVLHGSRLAGAPIAA